jgi:uncharacterized Zn-binding protein involved in type VI secretion
MRRYFARVGDETTSGGKVLEGIPNFTIYGKNATFHGAMVSCPRCNTIGRIFGKGPRRPFKAHGKDVALGGDICLCKCDPPPQIIPSQTNSAMDVQSEPASKSARTTSRATQLSAVTSNQPQAYDLHFLVLDSATGKPMVKTRYSIRSDSETVVNGYTDSQGKTDLIRGDFPEDVVIEIFSETTPINPYWDQ